MKVQHILVPYDGSKQSERAFDEALKVAKKDKSKISSLTCYWLSTIMPFWNVNISQTFDDFINPEKFPAKVKNLEKKAQKEKIPFLHYNIETQYVVDSIISCAKENKIDLIIMGSRNLKGIKKIFQGSVSDEIKRHAHCIVRVVT